jgi:hypothetical protein
MLDQIIKGCAVTMHNAALLKKEIANLRAANKKKRQKRGRSTKQMAYDGGLSVEDGIQLVQQLNQPPNNDGVGLYAQGDLAIQQDQPRKRAPPRCSACGHIGHKINQCKNR